jgi:hypothetical protein
MAGKGAPFGRGLVARVPEEYVRPVAAVTDEGPATAVEAEDSQSESPVLFVSGSRLPSRRLTLFGVGLELGLLLTDYWLFRLFDGDYFRWWLRNGAAFALVFAFISGAIDLDRYVGLVAVAPGRYLAAWMDVVGSIFLWWSVSLGSSKRPASADILPTALIAIVVGLALAAWVIVVAPVQYLVTLLAGAPARLAFASDRKLVVSRSDEMTVWRTLPVAGPLRAGTVEVGFRTKPVTFANAIAAVLLFGVSFAL